MELDIETIALLAKQNEDENINFRSFLKGKDSDVIDKIVQRLNKEITSQIDCQECGNCCNILKPCVTESEIKKLSQIKGITQAEFISKYVEMDSFDNVKYLKDAPCIFLNEKSCSIYNDRPKDCKSYPHTQKSNFNSRTISMIHNYEVCPIVFNLFEKLKIELNYKSKRRY
ncbi:MAG: YkgJ family cysteine cluster protein [Bacteroidota bacterium]